jgi:metal-dependent amidase/aminoacylase/carboxypeptidase family protein
LFEKNGVSIGIEFETDEEKRRKFGGSTDMGNVSHVIPCIHPKFSIGTTVSNHSKEFTVAAGDMKAQKYTLDVAKALAMTALDVYNKPELLAQIKADFEKDVAET